VFRFPDGALGELTTGSGFTAADNSVEVYGSEGSAILSGVDLASRDLTQDGFLKVYRRGQAERRWIMSPIVPRFKTGGFHQQNALHFLEALALGMPPPITLEDGRRAVAMIVAAYAAARTGQRTLVSPAGGTA
jgi:predicted dehydrogenase